MCSCMDVAPVHQHAVAVSGAMQNKNGRTHPARHQPVSQTNPSLTRSRGGGRERCVVLPGSCQYRASPDQCQLNIQSPQHLIAHQASRSHPTSLTAVYVRLADDPKNVKALYRRGQALTGLLDWEASVTDLTAAFRGTAGDPAQQGPIKEKLQAAKDQLSRARANGTLMSKSVLPTVSAAPGEETPALAVRNARECNSSMILTLVRICVFKECWPL